MSIFSKILDPELFQGSLRRRGYFEGWYFKLRGAGGVEAAAAIPGVALGERGSQDSHAFVQFIAGGRAEYFRYPLCDFDSGRNIFRVRIGGSEFGREGVRLNLHNENCDITGKLEFSNMVPFPRTLLRPGIMGPLSFVPGMECYHGVVSLRHDISGALEVEGRRVSYDGGVGYIEKDWGRSFPRAWVWVQANGFPGGASFLFSAAEIPFCGGSFRGFFALLWHEGRLRLFATYTGAKLLRLAEAGGATEAAIAGRGMRLEISARPGPGGLLKAPKNGAMENVIEESLQASVSVRLTDADGGVLFEGECASAGLERHEFARLVKRERPG